MTFSDGTAESKVTLAMAKVLKDKLLSAGYDVLMIRDGEDVQLDNIARSVIANNAKRLSYCSSLGLYNQQQRRILHERSRCGFL